MIKTVSIKKTGFNLKLCIKILSKTISRHIIKINPMINGRLNGVQTLYIAYTIYNIIKIGHSIKIGVNLRFLISSYFLLALINFPSGLSFIICLNETLGIIGREFDIDTVKDDSPNL